MDFTKKVNEFGLFSSVLVVNNDIMESVSATKIEDEKEVLMMAAHITSKAVSNQVKDGKLTALEGLLAGMGASDSTNITLVTPNLKDIKLFTEAVVKTAEDAIRIASKFNLEAEVQRELDNGATPLEALREWNIV